VGTILAEALARPGNGDPVAVFIVATTGGRRGLAFRADSCAALTDRPVR
jgi:hypothetical protein